MKKTIINKELTLLYTEKCHIMSDKELVKFCGIAVNHWGICDEKNHCLFIVSWTKSGLLNFLTDAKSVIRGAERCMEKNLHNYRRTDSFTTTIAQRKAQSIRFTYEVNDSELTQIGETSVFRADRKFYAIQYISRQCYDDENRGVCRDILQSVALTV